MATGSRRGDVWLSCAFEPSPLAHVSLSSFRYALLWSRPSTLPPGLLPSVFLLSWQRPSQASAAVCLELQLLLVTLGLVTNKPQWQDCAPFCASCLVSTPPFTTKGTSDPLPVALVPSGQGGVRRSPPIPTDPTRGRTRVDRRARRECGRARFSRRAFFLLYYFLNDTSNYGRLCRRLRSPPPPPALGQNRRSLLSKTEILHYPPPPPRSFPV